MSEIVVKVWGGGHVGSVVLHDHSHSGPRWEENTPGEHFIGYDHHGTFGMGLYATAQDMFLEEPTRNPDEEMRRMYPEEGVLVLNNFHYPGTRAGQFGSGSLQYSNAVNYLRDWMIRWQVTSVG